MTTLLSLGVELVPQDLVGKGLLDQESAEWLEEVSLHGGADPLHLGVQRPTRMDSSTGGTPNIQSFISATSGNLSHSSSSMSSQQHQSMHSLSFLGKPLPIGGASSSLTSAPGQSPPPPLFTVGPSSVGNVPLPRAEDPKPSVLSREDLPSLSISLPSMSTFQTVESLYAVPSAAVQDHVTE